MNGKELMQPIIDAANRNNAPVDGDYVDEEGFLCCGKCRTRKQTIVHLPESLSKTGMPEDMKVGIPCECRRREIERQEKEERERKEMEAVAALKRQSLMD